MSDNTPVPSTGTPAAGSRLKLGFTGLVWSKAPPSNLLSLIAELDELGYDSYWTAEAYGADALTPLAWCASESTRLRFGTAVAQMSARTPAATAMAAMTVDHLTGGRFILGLGTSGPQVVEGWYGQDFTKPLARTREYIAILRAILARDHPLTFHGKHYQLPLLGGTHLGKPLKSTLHPLRPHLPIYLGAEGPNNITLAGEIADGWLAIFFSPQHQDWYTQRLTEGFARARTPRNWQNFEIVATTWVAVDTDTESAANRVRPALALYIGGMGVRGRNFHANVFARMGYQEVVEQVQRLYAQNRKNEAAAAIPTQLVEEVALVGPPDKIGEDLKSWQNSAVNTLLISGDTHAMRTIGQLNN